MERTEETLKARVRETPLTDRLSECQKRIGKMCAERRAPRMCIPVQHDDDDFFICTTLSDAQATVEALQAQLDKTNLENAYANNETQNILRGGILDRDVKISTLRQRVEALQRERDQWKEAFERSCDDTAHLKAAPDAEREKVKGQSQRAEYAEGKVRELLLKQDALELKLSQLQALVRAFFTSEDKWAVAYRELERLGYTLDATPTERGHE